MVEGGGFEPPKLSRQIYSLIPLAAREPLPKERGESKSLALLFRVRHFRGIEDLVQSFHRDFLSNPNPAYLLQNRAIQRFPTH